ncbi:MAG TPA: hypothetical protein VFF52_10390 [Isosphaeraceae bacterium]|nr:hypothetical protein [Isosphaeraceae bacterium]
MKRRWELKPNLLECILEDRVYPATNLGIIILTTSGLSLVTPFPGASNSAAGALGNIAGTTSMAASVSGAAMPTSFYITGNRGISTFTPGNFTGNPSVGLAVVSGSGGVGLTIQVGSGSDDASAPVATPTVGRSTVGGSATDAPSIMSYIGQPASGSNAPILPEGQSYQAPTAPVPALPPMGVVIPGSPMGTGSSGSTMPGANPLIPQPGAQLRLPTPGGPLSNSLPGGLGVGSGSLMPGPSMN